MARIGLDLPPAAVLPHPRRGGRRARGADGPGDQVVPWSTIAGERVVNRERETLGTLEHVVIDACSGRIVYGVLSRGGVLGLGAKLFAVPWDALTRDVECGGFVLDVPLACVRDVPGFDRDRWPSTADARFACAAKEDMTPQHARAPRSPR